MSIRIDNGYRLATADPTTFLARVESLVAPVRDDLDAALYARIVADLIDRRDQGKLVPALEGHATLREAALAEFHRQVTDGAPGTILHHPHSFDIDYAYPPDNDGTHLFILVHCQRDIYLTAVRTIPDLTHFPYWNHVDPPEGTSSEAWRARRDAWEWLIDARHISDVTQRWTYRNDPSPNEAHITDPSVVLGHLPTPTQRARQLAQDAAMVEHFIDHSNLADRMHEVFDVLTGPRMHELTPQFLNQLRTITPADLTTVTA